MKRRGRARREVLIRLCPSLTPVVDVGADHGHVAAHLGAVATERLPGRRGRPDVPWVIADGLRPFRHVGVAIIAGMGARTIARILSSGARPEALVLHAQDDPIALRVWLAEAGWRIDAEALAPEAGRFAEVLRAVPGVETAAGVRLELGPKLLTGDDPHLRAHVAQLRGYWSTIVNATRGRAPHTHSAAQARVDHLIATQRDRHWSDDAPGATETPPDEV